MHEVHFMSRDQTWETPQPLFLRLHREFSFTLDACALPHNAKLPSYFSPDDDALTQTWSGRVWMNPPYGRDIAKWVRYAYEQSRGHAELVVCLLPSKTETAWWHDWVMQAFEIRLIRGRLAFSFHGDDKGNGHNAPFPSSIVIFRNGHPDPAVVAPPQRTPVLSAMLRDDKL